MATRSKRRRTRWRVLYVGRVLLAVAILGAAGGLLLWQLTWVAPLKYRPPAEDDAQAIALAEKVEYRLIEEAQKVRKPDDTWTLRVRDEQVNAWLATRLAEWVAHEQDIRLPNSVRRPQVAFDDDGVRLFLEIVLPDSDRPRVLTADIAPRVDDQGLWLTVEGVSFGMIPMRGKPVERIGRLIEQLAPEGSIDRPAMERAMDLLSGRRPVASDITLADGRHVRIMDLDHGNGFVDITSRTIPEALADAGNKPRSADEDPREARSSRAID